MRRLKKIEVIKVRAVEVEEGRWFCLVDQENYDQDKQIIVFNKHMTVFERLPGRKFIEGEECIPIRLVKPRSITKPGRFYVASDAEVLAFKAKPLELLTLLSLY